MTHINKPRVLFLVQLPPPVHGASLMNQFLVNSKTLNEVFDVKTLNLDFATSIRNIGKVSFTKLVKMISFAVLLIKTLFKSKFSLVYLTLSPLGGAFYRDVLFVFILKIFRSNVVYHLHGKGIFEEIKNPIKKKIYSYVFNDSSVICLSNLLHFDIEEVFKGNIYDVANGIPLVSINNIDRNPKELLYLSSLAISKGILDFVDALKILNAQGVDFQAKIIGSSTKDLTVDELRNIIIENKLSDKVRVLGPIYGEDKFIELAKSGVFCLPTRNDCFPLSILEAMMMGLVSVSTNNGAISEIINHKENGMIVPVKQPKELAITLLELLNKDSDEMIVLSQNAKEKFSKNYSINVFEKNMVSVFNKILIQKLKVN